VAQFCLYNRYETKYLTTKTGIMKKSILPIAKTAMKYFFDLDPILTEHVVTQVAAKGMFLGHEFRQVLHTNIQQSKSKVNQLFAPINGNHSWNAA